MKLLAFLLLFLGLPLCLQADFTWEEIAKKTEWYWPPGAEPALLESAIHMNGPYNVVLEHDEWERFKVSILRDGHVRIKFPAHSKTVFVQLGNLFAYADFSPWSCGCTMTGFDLDTGKQIWTTRLEAVGEISHSKYSNRIFLQMHIPKEIVSVYGWEGAGKYLEYLDLKTGKVLATHVCERAPR